MVGGRINIATSCHQATVRRIGWEHSPSMANRDRSQWRIGGILSFSSTSVGSAKLVMDDAVETLDT